MAHDKAWTTLEACRYLADKSNDGDSFLVQCGRERFFVRLYFVDAPESDVSFPDRVRQQYEYFGVTLDELTRAGARARAYVRERSCPEAFRRPHEEDVRPGTQQGHPVLRPGAGRRPLSPPGSCQRRARAQQGQPPRPAVRRDGARSRAATPVNRGPRQAAAPRHLGQPRPASPMSPLERYYKIDQLLKDRKVVSFALFKEKLGMSRASVKRDLEYMRSRFNAPIEYDRAVERLPLRQAAQRPALRAAGPVVQRRRSAGAPHHAAASLQPAARPARRPGGPGARAPALDPRHRRPLLGRGGEAHAHLPARAARREGRALQRRRRRAPQALARLDPALQPQGRPRDRARDLAAAPGALPRQLVPRRVLPPAPGPAQLRRRRDP